MNKQKPRMALLAVLCVLLPAVTLTVSALHSFKNTISAETEYLQSCMADVSLSGHAQLQASLQTLVDESRAAAKLVALADGSEELLYRSLDLSLQDSPSDAVLLFGGDGALEYGAPEYRDLFSPNAMQALRSPAPVFSDSIICSDGISRFSVSVPCAHNGSPGSLSLILPVSVIAEPEVPFSGITLRLLNAYGSAALPGAEPSPWQLMATGGEPAVSALSGSVTNCPDSSGNDWLVLAEPTGFNSWYLVCGVPMSYIYSRAAMSLVSNSLFIFVTLAVLLAMVIFGISFINSRQKRLALERQRFDFAARQSNRTVFEYSRSKDRLSIIGSCEGVSLPEGERSVPLSWLVALIHPDDRQEFDHALNILHADGCTRATLRIRGLRPSADYHWHCLTAEELTRTGSSIVIGILEDIDDREKEHLALLHKAITDPLTGLYNRVESERMINELLSSFAEGEAGTFCIVDLDNFKQINDTNGHYCGDLSLIFFAECLRSTFSQGDIIGRLGGDEFVVFMSRTSDKELVLRRLDALTAALSRRTGGESALPELSCSIGCVTAQTGDDFGLIYNLADKALYRAKTSGKRKTEFEIIA